MQNTSITSCLRNFSSTETLCSDNKFKCDTCSAYQVSINQLLFNRDPSVQTISSCVIRAAPTRYQSINFSSTETSCSDNKFKCDACFAFQVPYQSINFSVQQRPSVQTISSCVIRAATTSYQSINFSSTETLCSDKF